MKRNTWHMGMGFAWLFFVSVGVAQLHPTGKFEPGDLISVFIEDSKAPAGVREEIPAAIVLTVQKDGTVKMPWNRSMLVTEKDALETLSEITTAVRQALWFVEIEVSASGAGSRGRGKVIFYDERSSKRCPWRSPASEMGDHWLPGEYEKEMKRRFPDWYKQSD